MESLFQLLIGVGELVLGGGMVARARKPGAARKAFGGLILMIIGILVLAGGIWSAGTLMGNGG